MCAQRLLRATVTLQLLVLVLVLVLASVLARGQAQVLVQGLQTRVQLHPSSTSKDSPFRKEPRHC